MDVAQDLIYTASRYIYSEQLMIVFSWCLLNAAIFLKNHVSCNFKLKYYIPVLLRQGTKTLNKFFYLSRANENLEISMPVWFGQVN